MILTLIDRKTSPSVENYCVTKMDLWLNKASIELEFPGDFWLFGSKSALTLHVELKRYIGPRPALALEPLLFLRPE